MSEGRYRSAFQNIIPNYQGFGSFVSREQATAAVAAAATESSGNKDVEEQTIGYRTNASTPLYISGNSSHGISIGRQRHDNSETSPGRSDLWLIASASHVETSPRHP